MLGRSAGEGNLGPLAAQHGRQRAQDQAGGPGADRFRARRTSWSKSVASGSGPACEALRRQKQHSPILAILFAEWNGRAVRDGGLLPGAGGAEGEQSSRVLQSRYAGVRGCSHPLAGELPGWVRSKWSSSAVNLSRVAQRRVEQGLKRLRRGYTYNLHRLNRWAAHLNEGACNEDLRSEPSLAGLRRTSTNLIPRSS